MNKTVRAFAPAAISSFFEICDQTVDGKPISDPERVGARGGGFGLQKGTLTELTVSSAKENHITVYLNGDATAEAKTTQAVLRLLLKRGKGSYDIVVRHKVKVPIGAGFGTSAGGALAAGLALKEALALPLTFNQVAKAAHIAEVQCQTGLGTVSSLAVGGSCLLVLEPGAPGIAVVDRIPLKPGYVVVAGVVRASGKSVLSSPLKRPEINRWGKETLEAILAEPSLENFLASCWRFAQETGFATEKVRQLVRLAEKNGAVGAAQNMIGEAVHAVALEENAPTVEEAFKQVLRSQCVFVSKLDSGSARLVES